MGHRIGGSLKVGDMVRHVNEGWWGMIVEIKRDPNTRASWLEIYCAKNEHVYGRWSSQVEVV